jgi:hypothetical protein
VPLSLSPPARRKRLLTTLLPLRKLLPTLLLPRPTLLPLQPTLLALLPPTPLLALRLLPPTLLLLLRTLPRRCNLRRRANDLGRRGNLAPLFFVRRKKDLASRGA